MEATSSLENSGMAVVGATYFSSLSGENLVRSLCVRKFLRQMSYLNQSRISNDLEDFPVIIADASPDDVHEELSDLFTASGATVLDARDRRGIASQNQMAIAYALEHGARFCLRTELEKYGVAEPAVLRDIYWRMAVGNVDLLCIGRTPGAAYESLPPFMQVTERVMSRAIASLGLPEDSACGLRAMNRAGAEAILNFDTAQYGNQWQYLWFPMIDAIRAGLRVDGLLVDMIHPVEMTREETGNPTYDEKRSQQAAQLIPAVVEYAVSNGMPPKWDPDRKWII